MPKGRPKRILAVLAHQDDEVFMTTRLARERAQGHEIFLAYLTNGASRVPAHVRDAESRAVLERIGIPERNVAFLGSVHGIPDLGLVGRLEEALGLVEDFLGHRTIDRVYGMAWEGGHPDHDAAHLVVTALARRRQMLARCWQVPGYHGHGVPWKLFRGLALLPSARHPRIRTLTWREALAHSRFGLMYPSQWRTWIGMFPALLWRRLVRRQECMAAFDQAAVLQRPHPGRLYYETRFGCRYEDFAATAQPFVATHLR